MDITVDLGTLQPKAFVAALARAGFIARFDDDVFLASTHVVPVTHAPTGMPMDLVLAGPGLEQLFLERAELAVFAGKQIPVISPEHLIVTKVLAGRSRDIEDVRELLAMRELDHAEIEELLRQLEVAIDDSELLATYRRLREGR